MSRVLVTDGEERAALAAVRSLGRRHRVLVAGVGRVSLAGCSRSAAATMEAPDPLASPDAFRAAIAARVRADGIEVVLPVSDASCRALLGAGELRPARVAGPTREAYDRLSDKAACLELARRHGLEAPAGERAENAGEAVAIAERLGFPVILKPVLSVAVDAAGAVRKRGVEQVCEPASLRAAWDARIAPGAALVQRIVPGKGEGLFVLRWAGKTRAAFAHRRLREKPPEGGASVLRESIAVDPVLLGRMEAILDEAGFEGVAMAEFRSQGTQRWLMEFNARLWGSLQLAVDAGVDFPGLLVDAALGAAALPPPGYRTGVRSRWLLGDLDHALALARGAHDAEGRSGLAAALGVWLRPAGPHCRWEDVRGGDLAPFAHSLGRWLHDALR